MNYCNLKNQAKDLIKPLYFFFKDNFDYKSNQLIKKNAELNNKYLEEKCFLLMTGDSINAIDIAKLKGQLTFGVNWVFMHKDVMNLPLTFYLGSMFSDRHYLKPETRKFCWPERWTPERAHKTIKEQLIEQGTHVFFKADDFRLYMKKYEYDIHKKNIYFLKTRGDFNSVEKPQTKLNKRFSIFEGGGCQYTSLFILIYLGFKEIYLCGAGYTYDPMYMLHFYDNMIFPKSMGKEKAIQAAKKAMYTRNKKYNGSLEYYGLLDKEDFFRGVYIKRKNEYSQLSEKHSNMNKFAESQGVKIFNIVPEGFESPVFELTSWEKIVDKFNLN